MSSSSPLIGPTAPPVDANAAKKVPDYYSRLAGFGGFLAVASFGLVLGLVSTVGLTNPGSRWLTLGALSSLFLTGIGVGIGLGTFANAGRRDKILPILAIFLNIVVGVVLVLLILNSKPLPSGR